MYHNPENAMYYVIYHQHTDKNSTKWTGTLVDKNGDMLLSHDNNEKQKAKYCMYCSEEVPAWMLGFQAMCKWER